MTFEIYRARLPRVGKNPEDQQQEPRSPQSPTGCSPGCLTVIVLGVVVAVVFVVASVFTGDEEDGDVSGDGRDPSDFEQTWAKGYGETTCTEWATVMTTDQRRVAAADMLVSAWETDGESGVPSDALIADFEFYISDGCEPIPSLPITEIAAAQYVVERDRFAP